MHARELFLGGCARLQDIAFLLTEFRRDDLHHLRAFEALGMTGRIEVIGKTVRREDGQRHGVLQIYQSNVAVSKR